MCWLHTFLNYNQTFLLIILQKMNKMNISLFSIILGKSTLKKFKLIHSFLILILENLYF